MCEDRISDVLSGILEAVEDRIAFCDHPGFCRVGLVGGSVAWDDCCDCGDGSGQLWVRLIEWIVDPTLATPGVSGCDDPTTLVVGVGHLRCVPTLDEEGNPPSAEDEEAAARLLHADAQILKDAVMCNTEDRTWLGWQPLGYEGGCGGGEHIFQILHVGCGCDDAGSPGSI